MDWTRADTLTLAHSHCTNCHGLGLLPSRGNTQAPCYCVLRSIFRACYARFRECVDDQERIGRVTLEFNAGHLGRSTWARKQEEYAADFFLVSRRSLTPDEFRIFRYHFLLGADWNLCCRKLKVDRGTFFHAVYRIERKLGRVFRELQPYGLYPLDEYFSPANRTGQPVVTIDSLRREDSNRPSIGDKFPLGRVA
jgi:hypothetical protein